MILACLFAPPARAQGAIYSITVEGTIDAGVADFIADSLSKAERENAPLLIKLDTPGGLLSATEEVVKRVLDSRVQVVVWVTPKGGWAYSAGTYILLASHVAAMDRGTAIGAAEPRPPDPKTKEAMARWIAELAELRGRSPRVAENFVRVNLTLGPEEALESGIIDLIAEGEEDILEYLNMRGAEIKALEMGALSKALRVLSNPEVVMILFIAGMLGIIVEITTPGVGVPGVGGGICLLLSFWGLGILELNYVAIALLVLGGALLAAEVLTPGFGVFGTGGVISLVLGFAMVDKEPWVEVLGTVLKGVLIGAALIAAVLAMLVRRALRRPVKVGKEALVGETGVAVSDLAPRGTVKIKGELWRARATKPIHRGQEVVVKGVKGLELVVEKRR